MPRDFGGSGAEQGDGHRQPGSWKVWLAEPRRLAATAAGVATVGFILGYLIVVLFVFPAQSTNVDLRRVPNVVGLSGEAARGRLGRAGLEYEEETGLGHVSPPGTIVAQEPLAGQMTAPGSAVRVTVSLGPKSTPVPNVVGLAYPQAEIALARAGYESEPVWVDAEADVGQVIDTQPAAGTPLQLPGSVRLFVSAGPRNVAVPDLVTLSLSDAEAALERLGLRLGEVTQDSASLAAPGTILAQSPSPGAVVERATLISVTIANQQF